MQERRATIRVPYVCRVQYRPFEDLLPRDGRLADLSDRGAGLLTHDFHPPGERLTLHLSLPEDSEGITATGVVRWSNPKGRLSRWCRLGVEWLPFEDTTRDRLHGFIAHRPQPSSPSSSQQLMVVLGLVVVLCLGGWMVSSFWLTTRTLRSENDTLQQELVHRNTLLAQLHQKEQGLQQQLTTVKTQFADATTEVARLDVHAQTLNQHMERLTQEIGVVQEASAKLQQERDALMLRVLDLEQERLSLKRRLASLPELRLAVREAISARKAAQRTERKRLLAARRAAIRRTASHGNRGYLLRSGRPTIGSGTVWIRVYDPTDVDDLQRDLPSTSSAASSAP